MGSFLALCAHVIVVTIYVIVVQAINGYVLNDVQLSRTPAIMAFVMSLPVYVSVFLYTVVEITRCCFTVPDGDAK